MGGAGSGWTDAEKDLVRKLHAEGLSASEISKRLVGRSRNAVIGTIHRCGMRTASTVEAQKITHQQRIRAIAKPPRSERAPMTKAEKGAKAGRASILASTHKATKPVSVKTVGVIGQVAPEAVAGVVHVLAAALREPPHTRAPVSMMALEAGMCRNPVSDSPDGPLFCGAPVVERRKSYCINCGPRLLASSSPMRPIKALTEPEPRHRVAVGHIRYGG